MNYLLSEKTKNNLEGLIQDKIIDLTAQKANRRAGQGRGGGSSGSGVIPAKVVSKDGAFYVVDLYANGYNVAATATNQYNSIRMLNYADTLPAGTEIIVLSSFVSVTGGGDVPIP